MNKKLIKEYKIPASFTDNRLLLSYPAVFSVFMDLASEHADILNIGADRLIKDNLIWIASKTKVIIHKRPEMLRDVTISTWPEKPGNIRMNRYYTICQGDEILIEGKNEWTIFDLNTNRPRKTAEVYPADIEHLPDIVCSEPFDRIPTSFDAFEDYASYTVRSGDIDSSQHMNNVAYIRAVMGSFSCKEIEEMDISQMEIAYRAQCFEGETLSFRRREEGKLIDIGIIKSDGTTAAVLRIKRK